MFSLLWTVNAFLAPDFKVNDYHCVDKGVHESYCFMHAYPYYNKKLIPFRSELHTKFGLLLPLTRREHNGNIGLRFLYKISCHERDMLFRCKKGDVTVNVHPSNNWDRPYPWLQILVNSVLYLVLIIMFSPVLLVSCSLIDSCTKK